MPSESASVQASELRAVKASKRILVVDDEEDLVFLISLQLEREGYQVFRAFNGLEALEKVVSLHPDLVVLDIMMPKVDGWVVCHSIKSQVQTKDVKVIILSALNQIRARIKGLYIFQADLYMTKPFEIDDLSESISRLLYLEKDEQPVAQAETPGL
jgi:DNA-binding response OmpR family regulator